MEHIHSGHPHVMALRSADASKLPESIDWRKHGAVSPVPNQGRCGSCWAYAAIGVVEGAYAIKSDKKAVSLSVQQMLDCVHWTSKTHWLNMYWSQGCRGGFAHEGLKWLKDTGSYINEETKYPYRHRRKQCRQYGKMLEPFEEKKRFMMKKFDKLMRRDQGSKRLSHFINVKRWMRI